MQSCAREALCQQTPQAVQRFKRDFICRKYQDLPGDAGSSDNCGRQQVAGRVSGGHVRSPSAEPAGPTANDFTPLTNCSSDLDCTDGIKKKPSRAWHFQRVDRDGIEPPTQGFSVLGQCGKSPNPIRMQHFWCPKSLATVSRIS